MMKLAYYFARRQFGKVLTPLKVHSARLPAAFGLFYSKIGYSAIIWQIEADRRLIELNSGGRSRRSGGGI